MSKNNHRLKDKVAIIIGATGLVGQHLVEKLADNYAQVIAIVRNPPNDDTRNSENVIYHKLANFTFLSDELDALSKSCDFTNVDAFSALGTTLKDAGSKTAFAAIDYGFNFAFAQTLHTLGVTRFFLLSSLGASSASKTSFYLCTKGELENSISALGFDAVYIFQPSLLLGKHEGRFAEQATQRAFGLVRSLVPKTFFYRPIEAERVAQAMVLTAQKAESCNQLANKHAGKHAGKNTAKKIVSNADMLSLTL